jgi:hypothetical protein
MKNLLVILLTMAISASAFAQAQPAAPASQAKPFGPKRQAAIIIFSGLGGAILGLSTLSFYGRPQDKLSNIAIGAAVGIIVGTIYVTYKAATQPADFYGEQYRGAIIDNPYQINTRDPVATVSWNF